LSLTMLDADVCVDYLRGNPAARARLQALRPSEVSVSVVVACELRYGAERSRRPRKNHRAVEAFLAEVGVSALAPEVAARYGLLRGALEHAGQGIGPNDTLIAAHAVALRAGLATRNVREFQRVPDLRVVDWGAVPGT